MNTLGSVAAVIAAVREEAAAEMDRLAREAAATRAALALERDRPVDMVDADRRVAEAHARAQRIEDETSWNDTLDDLQDRERWIAAVAAAARPSLIRGADGDWTRAWTAMLAREGMEALPPGACTIVVPASQLGLFDDRWRADLEARSGRAVAVEGGAISAGCLIRLVDRPIAYDNSLDARERRLHADWRAALARLYDALPTAGDKDDTALAPAVPGRSGVGS